MTDAAEQAWEREFPGGAEILRTNPDGPVGRRYFVSKANWIEGYRAGLEANPSEELMEQLRLADAMADSGAHSYTCALTVTDYEQGVECDCGWRPALDAYLAARAALRTTKEGEDG